LTELPAKLQCCFHRLDRRVVLVGEIARLRTALEQLCALDGR
jgi:hypothetical protein